MALHHVVSKRLPITVFALAVLACAVAASQESSTPLAPASPSPAQIVTPRNPFDVTTFTLSFSQAASANWAQGGLDFVSLSGGLKSSHCWIDQPVQLRTVLLVRLGASHVSDTVDSDAFRVSDNEWFCEATCSLPLGWVINPYISGSVRSAVTESFFYYGANRFRLAKNWDPITTQQSLGFAFASHTSESGVNVRLGGTLSQIRAESHTAMSDDPNTHPARERYRAMSGIEAVADVTTKLDSAVVYNGRHMLSTSFDDLAVWSLRSENAIQVSVWRFISVSLGISIIHDIRMTRRTQWRQSLMLGFVQRF